MDYLQVSKNIFVTLDDRPNRNNAINTDDNIDLHTALYPDDDIDVLDFIEQLDN
jgi:hypothetical protein